MRIFKPTGEKLYQEWVLRFCTKETKSQGPVPFNLLANPVLILVRKFDSMQPFHKLVDVNFVLSLHDVYSIGYPFRCPAGERKHLALDSHACFLTSQVFLDLL